MSKNFPASVESILNHIQLNKLTENIVNQALEEDLKNVDSIFKIGLQCAQKNNLIDALLIFECLQRYKKNDFRVSYNLGLIYSMLGKNREALSSYEFALKESPNDADVLVNMGAIYNEMNESIAALQLLERAIKVNPSISQAWFNRGNALYELKRYDEAITSYDEALILDSSYADIWSNKGISCYQLKRYDEAIASYDKALELNPKYADAWFNRGVALKDALRIREAQESFDHALRLNPELDIARWAKVLSLIPIIFSQHQDLALLRNNLEIELEKLDQWFTTEKLENAYQAVGSSTPFYLSYQEKNNKTLLSRYGAICNRLMGYWQKKKQIYPRALQHSGKIKIGIVSHHIRDHSVWHAITRGLLENIDQNRFEIHLFYLGKIIDEETKFARSKVSSYTDSHFSLSGWVKAVHEKEIEVLIYPEIGMEQLAIQLANLRLAPMQVAAWGHPETTGIPNIDYYMSADLFESAASREAYSENLIQLPNLGCFYKKLPVIPSEFNKFSFKLNCKLPILIAPGTLFKYAPQNDYIFVEIAKRLGECKFIFFNQQENWTKVFKERLKNVFDTEGLSIDDYIIFMPWLKPEDFYGLMNCSDVFLDPIGFSGFNTAMQAVDCALPIVTLEGQFMRGRLASGILKRMEISELIARNNSEYVELAIRLVKEHSYRERISQKMIEARTILYDDLQPILALQSFLEEKCRGIARKN